MKPTFPLRNVLPILAAVVALIGTAHAEDPIFSGPAVGEKLPAFKVTGVFDGDAGKELDFVTQADGGPIVLIFVHDLNRQSVAMTRTLSRYTTSRAKDGLVTGVVWLDDDATEAETTLKRIRHALAKDAAVGISVDGREGPGSYGLNRKVMLTILVGDKGKVTSNFALVQPSLQADLPKILESVVAVVGGKAPNLEELEGMRVETTDEQDPKLRGLLRPVIQKEATAKEVEQAGQAVEAYVEKNAAARRQVGQIANTIIDSGKLDNYGTERAREFLRKWAKEYGGKPENKETPDEPGRGERE